MNSYTDTVVKLVKADRSSLVMIYGVMVTTCGCAMCGRPTRSGARPVYGRRWVPVCAICWTEHGRFAKPDPDPRCRDDRGTGGTRP